MIYSASSLLLATLVFNAASVWGAPVPVSSDGSPVVRSTGDDIVPRNEWTVIDVPATVRSVDPEVDARDTASSESIEARDSLPEVERIVRRFPRKVYQDYYTKRSPSPTPDDEPVARSPEVVERRFPRRALYERHEAGSNPAPEARSEQPEPADIQRRYPRKVYADFYQKREPSPPINVEARDPAPELTDSGRRFPRQVLAERFVKRQDAAANPPADPAAPAPEAANPTPVAPAASSSATVSASASTATATTANVPLDLNRIVKDITSGDLNSFQPGTTIKETTLLVNKITHISDKGNAAQNAPVVPPVSGGTPASPATPSSSASSSAASPTSTAAAGGEAVTPPVAAAPVPESVTPPAEGAADPSATAVATTEGAPAEGGASRRSVGSNIRRQLGYSGPAWASHLKRNVN